MIIAWLLLSCFVATLLPDAESAAVQEKSLAKEVSKVVDPEKAKRVEALRKQGQEKIDAEKEWYEALQKVTREQIEENKKAYEEQQKELLKQIEQDKIQLEDVVKNLTEQVKQETKQMEDEHKRVLEAQELERKQLEKKHQEMFNELESQKEQVKKEHEHILEDTATDRKRLDEEHAQMLAALDKDRKEQEKRLQEIWDEVERQIKEEQAMWNQERDEESEEKRLRMKERGPRGCKRVKNLRDKKSQYPKIDGVFNPISFNGEERIPKIQKKYETYECQDNRYGNFFKLTTIGSADYGFNGWDDGSTKSTLYYFASDWSNFDWEPDMSIPEEDARLAERKKKRSSKSRHHRR